MQKQDNPWSLGATKEQPAIPLLEIARGQRLCIVAVGLSILSQVLRIALASLVSPTVSQVSLVFFIGVVAFTVYAVYKYAKALGKTPIVYSLLMFIPCLSTICLLYLNQAGTKILQENGVKVGFFGARDSDVPDNV